jgi:predicted dehydrogenase
VICEKPLGRDAAESYETWQRVQAAGVKHMCAFNYRFVPAVRLAREMIEAGELGEILTSRRYLQEWGATDAAVWRFDRAVAGSGALGDLGAHVVDLARYLVGEIASVGGPHAYVPAWARGRRRGRGGGVVRGRRDRHDRGVAVRDRAQERLHLGDQRLQGLAPLRSRAPQRAPGPPQRLDARVRGRRVPHRLVSEPDHPFWEHWWPQGHIIGWEHTFVHELHHLLAAIRDDATVGPHGATLEDGYRAAEVCDAMLRSSNTEPTRR